MLVTLLLGMFPATASAVTPVPNDNLNCSDQKIYGFWLNPSNYTVSETNIVNLANRGVTDVYVLVKGEDGGFSTSTIKKIISYAPSSMRVHAWMMCSRDNTYLRSNPKHAVYHFRFGYKNNAHSSSSSYYVDRKGYVDLRNSSYKSYFNGLVDQLEAISGLDGIHLDTIRYGGDYYGWNTDLRTYLGASYFNTVAKAMCKQHGYTYSTDADGYVVFKDVGTADDASLTNLVNADGAAAKKFRQFRQETITGFIKSVKQNLKSGLILTTATMPEPAMNLAGRSTYGQDFAAMAPYIDYTLVMSYFGDYFFLNGNSYNTKFPATLCKNIAKEGCNVVAGIQAYAFVNDDTSGRNGLNPSGYEARAQAEYLNDARREVNGDPTYGGDILGAAVFRGGTSAHVKITYNAANKTVNFNMVAGETRVKSLRIELYSGFVVDKSRCTVSTSNSTYTYNDVTYTYGGTENNGYYTRLNLSVTIEPYKTKSLTIPVCNNTGGAISPNFNNNHFAAFTIYNSTSKSNSTFLAIYQESFVDSTHTKCTFTKTTPQPATCIQPGYHLYTCKVCGYDYDEYIAPLAHNYSAVVTAPTCTEQGFTTYTCQNGCNDSYDQDYVEPLGHTYTSSVTPPSCTDDGYTTTTCSNCGESSKEQIVPALGHRFGTETLLKEPTCTEEGSKGVVCETCGYEESIVIEALGHDYEAVVTDPTCTHEGYTTYTCKNCPDTYTDDPTDALGHSYQETLVLAPTCTEEGTKLFACACGESYIEAIEALGHGETEETIIESTCTEDGLRTITCLVCDEVIKTEAISATGHGETNETVQAATCTEDGLKTFTCIDCEAVIATETIPALGHGETTETLQEATCTEDGFRSVICLVCNEEIEREILEAIGHSYESEVTAATCTEHGFTKHTCRVCFDSYITDEVAATGHDCVYTDNGENHIVKCNHCDYSELRPHEAENFTCIWCNAALCNHSEKTMIVDREATCEESGEQRVYCADCEIFITTEEIPAKGHDGDFYAAVSPSCTQDGNRSYYQCKNCLRYFTDDTYIYDIPESFVVKPALGHKLSYTNNGKEHTVSCANCDYRIAEIHTFEDGKCICGADEAAVHYNKDLMASMSIIVGAEMSVAFSVMNSVVGQYEDFYLVIEKEVFDGDKKQVTYGFADGNEPFTALPATGTPFMFNCAFTGITAKEMGDTISATLYAVAADGTIYYGPTKTDSIKNYLIRGLALDTTTEPQKTMYVDMLTYGSVAQRYFNYNEDNLVVDDLPEEYRDFATNTLPDATDLSNAVGNQKILNTSVVLKARVTLSLNTVLPGANVENMKFVVKDAKTGVIIEEIEATTNGIMVSADFDDVGAKQMRRLISVTLYDGKEAITQTVTWSVESYVAKIRATSTDAGQIDLVNAMLTYGDAVAAYMATQ